MYSKILRSSLTIVKIPNRSQEISSVQSFTRSSINCETTRTLSQEAKYKRMPGDTAAAFVDFSFETITEMIEKTCEYHAENPMFGTKKGPQFEWMTYKEFYSIVGKTRNVLRQLGLKKNDKVSIISNNRWEWASIVYSTMGVGGQIVPMYEAQLEEDWKYITRTPRASSSSSLPRRSTNK